VTQKIERLQVAAYTIPTDAPESDGTYEWNATTLVLVQLSSGDLVGTGYSYTDAAAAHLIANNLADIVVGADAMAPNALWQLLFARVRNLGVPGICATAISAVDSAAWDLKARLLGTPLVTLLGQVRNAVPVYGSGGFTSYSRAQLENQFTAWRAAGITRFKMKIGRAPERDGARVQHAREVIGPEAALFVDANGAFQPMQALSFAQSIESFNVTWFEEPVVSDDLVGLRWLRTRVPAGMSIAAGEYGYTPEYFRRMLQANAVDVLQADATRCLGITGFLHAGALCRAFGRPLSAHCAPALHAHVCCAAQDVVHVEYFHDHARIEAMFFDNLPRLVDGALQPDLTLAGHGLIFKERDAREYCTYQA